LLLNLHRARSQVPTDMKLNDVIPHRTSVCHESWPMVTPIVSSIVYGVGNVGEGRLRAGPRYITQDAEVGQCVWMGKAYLVKISHDIDRLRGEGTVGSTKYDRSFLIHCSLPVARLGGQGSITPCMTTAFRHCSHRRDLREIYVQYRRSSMTTAFHTAHTRLPAYGKGT